MQLTRHSDYALRMLIFLGRQPDRLSAIAEIAEAHGISRTHLMKVANRLVRAGFIAGVRGRSGGLRLARPPGQILLSDVLAATEPSRALVDCGGCRIVRGCSLPSIFDEGLDAFYEVMGRYTLADLLLPAAKRPRAGMGSADAPA